MAKVTATRGSLKVTAHRGDAKTLIAFDLLAEAARKNLAGFTISAEPPGVPAYFLQNNLRFEDPAAHAQDPTETAFSSINAPFHKFRWVHVPGVIHQGLTPAFGLYRYVVTPRYFDARHSMLPLDPDLSASIEIEVAPFVKGPLATGFTRGFTQSQAFVSRFGLHASIRPDDVPLQWDTTQASGRNARGETFTYRQQYEWLGFTARRMVFDLLDEVVGDDTLALDVFAYDLNEPDIVERLLTIGAAGRARIILDDAALHHDARKPTPEDEFATLFAGKAGAGRIRRGHFSRYAHDKVFVVSREEKPVKVLTGSTNFSVTGLYVNSNHVLVFDGGDVPAVYAKLFQEVWDQGVRAPPFRASDLAMQPFEFGGGREPVGSITFSPHDEETARRILGGMVERIRAESETSDGRGSVLFAVMELGGSAENPVYEVLRAIHADDDVFSFGISDNPDGIALYRLGSREGVLVTGRPVKTQLPPPFNQVPNIGGFKHQIHHKFVVCGFDGSDPVVYCGSSNLALGGEIANGDNLLAIRDGDVATVFAIEALALVDHFNFLDSVAKGPKAAKEAKRTASERQGAVRAGWFLGTDDRWVDKFFDPYDLRSRDRQLFAG
ncbi:phospholipase D-like domain-containing protein [Methylobacterium radiotolerans]|uniref:phospholipase D-like domain-containing protein n=1 Tax=Methylobacterium radiotolerans TaxID=31998 RepID=UPI0038CF767E